MPAVATANPVLKRFRAALHELYGDRAERVVLYGSRTRGDAHEDSDYDIAISKRLSSLEIGIRDHAAPAVPGTGNPVI